MNEVSPIRSATLRKLHVPVGRMIGDSMCHYNAFRMLCLRLETASGEVGWGFSGKAYGGKFTKEAYYDRPVPALAELRAEFDRNFAPWIFGKSATGAKLFMLPALLTNDDLVANAVQMALWDLVGKEAGLPLYRLLGGENARESIRAYASGCEFPMPDAFITEFYGAKHRAGFRMFKLKVGHPDPEHDLRRLHLMREAIGPDSELAADANKAWTAQETVERIRLFNKEGANLAYIEDPLEPDDVEGYRYLATHCPIPVVGHDYMRRPEEMRPLLETGAIAMIRSYGGLDYALGLVPLALEFQRPIISGNTFFEWNIHFALACPQVDRIEFSDQEWNRLPLTPVTVENGTMRAPDKAGHGFEPNPNVLDEWTIEK